MPAFVLAPLILAVVLGVSGWAKARAVDSTVSVLRLLRLPNALERRWVALALPWGEGTLAAALLLAPAGPLQALAGGLTLVLMLAYWALVARALTFRPRPTCGCFGDIGDQRISGRTLLRNTVLVGLAAVHLAWALAGHSVLATLSRGVEPLLWVAGAGVASLVTWFVAARPAPEPRSLSAELAEPLAHPRRPIPRATLTDPSGRGHSLLALARDRPQLLLVVSCFCGSTVTALRAWPVLRRRLPELDVRLVFSGVSPRALTDDVDVAEAWSDPGGAAAAGLALVGSPSAVLLGTDGMLAGGPVTGNDEIAAFVEEIARASGETAPRA